MSFFPEEFLLIVDESHVTIPQVSKVCMQGTVLEKSLIDNGFRLPSAYDNRPLNFDEFWRKYINQVLFVSATPRTLWNRTFNNCGRADNKTKRITWSNYRSIDPIENQIEISWRNK